MCMCPYILCGQSACKWPRPPGLGSLAWADVPLAIPNQQKPTKAIKTIKKTLKIITKARNAIKTMVLKLKCYVH